MPCVTNAHTHVKRSDVRKPRGRPSAQKHALCHKPTHMKKMVA